MPRENPLTAVEKNILVEDIAKGMTQEAVARKLNRRVRTKEEIE